jgi:tRNA-dihydrouridine synthase B
VVANGDVGGISDALTVLDQSGADAVMVGRAHYGAPWLAGEIAHAAVGGQAAGIPRTAEALADYVVEHYRDMLSLYGMESGLRQARKHLGWYLDRHAPDTGPELRRAIMTGTDTGAVIHALREALLRAEDVSEMARAA